VNFQAVLAGLPDAVIAVDDTLRVVFWNAAAEVLTERSARRAEGRLLKEVFAADASIVRRLSETLGTGESRSEAEGVIERPDHREVPVSIVTAPLFDHAGRAEAAVAVVRDLSRIRQLEAEVRRGETLAAAGRMAVGLAHEIRNPLGAIRGAVQLLGRELGAESPLREYTQVLLTEVDRVNRIIEMLLNLARPAPIHPVPLNLHQLLERVALLSEENARTRRVTIVRRYDPSLPPILGDEDRLMQVFHNLVRNAIEAMAERRPSHADDAGQPQHAVRQDGPGRRARAMVEAQVMDEGAGIPAAARARIFDPFFSTKAQGLGLGLAICHQVLEQHRGAIHVGGTEGRARPSRASCRSPADMSARILIADDEDSLRWVLEKGLRGAGYDVTSVKDGTAATRAVEAEAFDLVFLDIRMPGLTASAPWPGCASCAPTPAWW
jgi:two-component system nitrogen regulation sensor histidine kinase GlnL